MAFKLLRQSLFSLKGEAPPPFSSIRHVYSNLYPPTTASGSRWLSITPLSASPQSSYPKNQQHKEQPSSANTSDTPRPYNEIPKTNTVLGLNLDVLKDSSNLVGNMEKSFHELGHIFKLAGIPGLPTMVCVVDPEDVEKAFRVGDKGYPERFSIWEWKEARKEANAPLGMFLANGEDWYRQRIPVSKFILMPRKMAEYHVPFNQVTLDYIKLLRKQRHEDAVFSDVSASLNKWSLESVSLFVLGKRMGCLGDEMPAECRQFVDDVHSFITTTDTLFYSLPLHWIWRTKHWKELVQAQEGMLKYNRSVVNQKIKEMERAAEEGGSDGEAELGTDFMTYMVSKGDMSVQEIAVNAMDLLNAGVDTTSMTIAGCLYSLAQNPDVQEKLRKEVRSVLGTEEMVTSQHIQDMPYLRDTIKETMRLFPIAPNNSRILKEDVVLSGYKVPAGTNIIMSTIISGRMPEFFPEPEKFKPERWSRDNLELPNSFTSLPFGFGRRMCVGRRVAELEMHILLAQLVRQFKIEYREKEPINFKVKLFYGPGRQMDLAFVDINN